MARLGRSTIDARGSGSVAVGLMVGNVLGYVLALVAARRLGPTSFGELSALLALVIVLAVIPTGLQTVIARAVAEGAPHPLLMLSRARWCGLAAALGAAAVVPLVAVGQALHASVLGCALVGLTTAPLLILGWCQGVCQGQERLGRLGVLLVLNNGGRAVGGLVGVAVWRSSTGAIAGAWLAALVAAGVALAWAPPDQPEPAARFGWSSALEVGRASSALLALFMCTGADVVLARTVLDPHAAGIYAAGAVVSKIAFWLPQFAAVTALPRLVDPNRRADALRVSLLVVGASSALVVGGCLLARDTVVEVVGGAEYVELTTVLPWFALLGGLWAFGQLFLFDALARRVRYPGLWLWLALVLLVTAVLGLSMSTVEGIVAAACLSAAGCVTIYAARARLVRSGD